MLSYLKEGNVMLRINNIKLDIGHAEEKLLEKISKTLKVSLKDVKSYIIRKKSIDARKNTEIKYIYCVDVAVEQEEKILKKAKNANISKVKEEGYVFPEKGDLQLKERPVIVGAGPAGLFCAYMLAEQGYCPLIIERGERVEERTETIKNFWQGAALNPESNVQFGEGGAGTFSDGKLNTLVKEKAFRNRKVLEVFVQMGADPSILYINKPHIGTDVLKNVIRNMRNKIIQMGGEFSFHSKVTDLIIEDGKVQGVVINHEKKIQTSVVVLAIGHSARDTFAMIKEKKLSMEQKSFAVGFRIEHPQKMVNQDQYGTFADKLGAADYKVTYKSDNGRGVYSFCMCPGGYVVNASSEEKHLAVNGMSYHDRAGENANSAIVVTVTPEDFGSNDVLAGVEFQRKLERAAYIQGNGKIPVQLFGDFEANRVSRELGEVAPQTKGNWIFGNLRGIFTEDMNHSIIQGIHGFARQLEGFDRKDAILLGVESRTSSPVRILRDDKTYESNISGIYPCGEGAGYAGGITSAGMDGIRTAEKIAEKYKAM